MLKQDFKEHCGFRAVIHQRSDQILFYIDKFVINNIKPGTSLCLDDIPNYYQRVVDNLNIPSDNYDNIIIINSSKFLYRQVDELNAILIKHKSLLTSQGQLIISINLNQIIYDRVNVTVDSLIRSITQGFVVSKKLINFKVPAGYGNCFLVLTNE
jgi:hypothetical protein